MRIMSPGAHSKAPPVMDSASSGELSVRVLPRIPGRTQPGRGFQHQRVHECLREISSQLAFRDVVLFRIQAR